MNRKSIWITVLFLFLVQSFSAAQGVHAASDTVKVRIPDFPVQINGQIIDNQHSKYPFLIYKDITYMPLTWDNTQELGIQIAFDSENGLVIRQGGGFHSGGWYGLKLKKFEQDLSASNSLSRSYTASMPGFSIIITDNYIDNWDEAFPLLVFQDVTYMPLTWTYVHEWLQLDILWDSVNGLNIIGNQEQILDRIYYDDKDYLYFYPNLVTSKSQGSIRVKKNLEEKPMWMTLEETEQLNSAIQKSLDPYAGQSALLDKREDGLYYQGMKLLTKEEITVDSTAAGNPFLSGLSAKLYKLTEHMSLLAVSKVIGIGAGQSMSDDHLYLIRDGKAKDIASFQQIPDRVIPNDDGSFWIISNGKAFMHGHIAGGTRKLALVDAQGNIRLANDVLNESDIIVQGLNNPGLMQLTDKDGRLMILRFGSTVDFQEQDTLGFYLLDTSFQVEKQEVYNELAKDANEQYRLTEIYMGIDRDLYLRNRISNTLINYTKNIRGMWYDYEMLETE